MKDDDGTCNPKRAEELWCSGGASDLEVVFGEVVSQIKPTLIFRGEGQ